MVRDRETRRGNGCFGSEDREALTRSAGSMMKFLCSYGGRIMPRLTDGKLRYVGGHTRVLSVERSISFVELMVRLVEFCGSSVRMRCPLPDGDLETLISITSDDDLRHVMGEYDRANSSPHPPKIRAILSPPKSLKFVSPPLSPPSPVGCCSPYQISESPPSAAASSPAGLVREARCVAGRRPFLVRNCHSLTCLVPHRSNWIN
uniref:PB1 domain-containing protein n=1 Tax=Kalanchoe fedtschenkoi TaxID=63787 RepID=A0A7N0SVN4_KALFE